MAMAPLIPLERIKQAILLLRGERVMLDVDLAALYGVTTKALNQAVKRNQRRFPGDFAFQLTWEEGLQVASRSQSVTLKRGKNIKYRPYAFTEQGVAMLSSVLRSARAAEVNVAIMRAFVQLRRLLAADPDLARRVAELEKTTKVHSTNFHAVFVAIRSLLKAKPPPQISPPKALPKPSAPIGFRPKPPKPTP